MKGRRALPTPRARRRTSSAAGPGNLTMAMGITLAENRVDLAGDRLFVEDRGIRDRPVVWGPRIGISVGTERPWRACVTGHPPCRTGTRPPA